MEQAFSRDDVSHDPATAERDQRPPNWVDELIAMTRPGSQIEFPMRSLAGRVIPFQYDDFS